MKKNKQSVADKLALFFRHYTGILLGALVCAVLTVLIIGFVG